MSTRHPPSWPGFESRSRRHMWVEFVVGSLLYFKRFFCGCSGEKHSGQFQIPFDLEGADMFQPVFKECSVWVDNYKKYSLNRSYALRPRLNRKTQRELWARKTTPSSKPSLYVPGVQIVELVQRERSRTNTVRHPEKGRFQSCSRLILLLKVPSEMVAYKS